MPNQPVLSVIAPCFNEEANVPVLAERMKRAFDSLPGEAELLLIDDGSRDNTWAVIQRVVEVSRFVRGERHVRNRGIVGGWKTGLAMALADVVCLIDSDLQNRPEDVPRMFAAWREYAPDIVQAVRHPAPDEVRTVFSRGLNLILNATFGMHLADNKSGFLLMRKDTLHDLLGDAEGYRYFQSLVGAAAGLRNLTIHEVDTQFDRRLAGESFLARYPLIVSARVLAEVARYRIAALRKGFRS